MWFLHVSCGLAVLFAAVGLRASPVYKCVDSAGHVAFQDTPCPEHTRQRKLTAHSLPRIGDPGEPAAYQAPAPIRKTRRKARSVARSPRKRKAPTWWECRAADGEVFYRHAGCPGSVPGDGTVREAYMEQPADGRRHRLRSAWDRVSVHGVKVSKATACSRIHAIAASSRDGYRRDETTSVYDRLMGRDPCTHD